MRFGVYEIAGPLGAGGMGEVYRAHDTRLHRDVALKVLTGVYPEGVAWRSEREPGRRARRHSSDGAVSLRRSSASNWRPARTSTRTCEPSTSCTWPKDFAGECDRP